MKRPLPPPPIEFGAYAPEKLERLFRVPRPAGYLHWDQLRHRPPPEGLTAEEWWVGLKLQRLPQARVLPLRDTQGRPFTYVLTDEMHRALHRIDAAVGGTTTSAGTVATPEHRDRYVFDALVEEAVTSSQLEGASTTRQVAADMIRYDRKPRDRSERMILNNYLAMRRVREHVAAPLSMAVLLDLHRIVTADTLDVPSAGGRLQQPGEVRVTVQDRERFEVLHRPPPAELLPERLAAMVRFANDSVEAEPFLHPVLRAIVVHFWLAYEHPFSDGNGRTARALFYWAMLRQGYRLFEFVSISRVIKRAPARYGRAFLYTETDGNDLTYFLLHQLRVIDSALDELAAYLARKREQTRHVERLLQRTNLNHRQIALLGHAIRHPGHEYTIKGHQRSHAVAYATARADLLSLAEAMLLEQARRGARTFVFIAPEDLARRLEARR